MSHIVILRVTVCGVGSHKHTIERNGIAMRHNLNKSRRDAKRVSRAETLRRKQVRALKYGKAA